ncbi:glutathione S-transferase theta-1-like [Anomaloglossus baeobatrachus]|uniref:glutathione S-transferase theta-4 n=1 Tax=Anomaloglossus baeobatrachus TaxID=238106 RepID=UPI003F5091AE
MSDLTLYLDLVSQPCRAVYVFAKANNIPFKHEEVLLFRGDQMAEDFGKVNPLRKVPSLKDGDFTMAESTAILQYLANKYKTPDHWYPSDLQKRARVDEYLAWQHTNTRPHAARVFWIKGMTPYLLGHEATPEHLNPALSEFNTTLKSIETKFLQDKPFFAGDEVSIADLVAIVEIMQPISAGVDVFEDKPKLSAWKHRVEEAIGADLFKEAHESIMRIKEMQSRPISPELKERLKARLAYFTR